MNTSKLVLWTVVLLATLYGGNLTRIRPPAVGAPKRVDLEDALQEIGPGCSTRPSGEFRC